MSDHVEHPCRRCGSLLHHADGLCGACFAAREKTEEEVQVMRLVVVESPFAGDRERNDRYLRACLLDALRRGEAPFASHAIYPLVLDDARPEERALGMMAGFAWGERASLCAAYVDLGWSPGMREGARRAETFGIPVETRTIPGWADAERAVAKKREAEEASLARYVRARTSGCLDMAPHGTHGDCPGLGTVAVS